MSRFDALLCIALAIHFAQTIDAFSTPFVGSGRPALSQLQFKPAICLGSTPLGDRLAGHRRGSIRATATAPSVVIEANPESDTQSLKTVAEFFVAAFFQDYKAEATLSREQLKRLGGEQFADMRQRYGGYVPLPSAMLVARTGEEIVGCAGLEIALVSQNNKLMPKTRANIEAGYTARPLLANLAVSPNFRRQGLARQLCIAGEDTVRSWGYTELLLLVESANEPALRLYKSLGYSEVWRDDTATASKAVPYAGTVALQKVQVCNIAMRKDLTKKPGLFGMFGF
eukprot:CAMPEP_0181327734 /NCGR_PEP_ID=MMETSP1101-20121128/22278_1 /TAXON_ID=46948 /ORGANISM="Rhodomonas abbreviata, Strain Caron Lab Isolate" /LENGTH=283 /DNA_ID=CAMNT_0023436451 /DNA_START=36 /DNA_END=887 /DNA_ORIENTATION=+